MRPNNRPNRIYEMQVHTHRGHNLLWMATALLTIVSLSACAKHNFSQATHSGEKTHLDGGCGEETFHQPKASAQKSVDLLFVTDTSGSLDDERATVAAGIDRYVAGLGTDVDYRIGVLAAHSDASSYYGRLLKAGSEPLVLDSTALTASEIRQHLERKLTKRADDGVSDGGELGLYSLSGLLSGAGFSEARSAGFFRDSAALAVVFISDENDICAKYPAGVTPVPDPNGNEVKAFAKYCKGVNWHETVYGQLTQRQKDRALIIGAIIYTGDYPFSSVGENEIGYGYTDMVDLNRGQYIDLKSDIGLGLEKLGNFTSIRLDLKDIFHLSGTGGVDADSIIVQVDGQRVPKNQIHYSSTDNSVAILDKTYLGQAESRIDIHYCQ